MRPSLITGPISEPVTLSEAKEHLRVTFNDEDSVITRLITGARQAFEEETGRQLITATWEVFLDRFPRFDHEAVEIAKPPLSAVNSVTYIDTSGALQTWSSSEYTVKTFSGPRSQRGMLYPSSDNVYPIARRIPNAVTINFDAGYGAIGDVPEEIKEALLAWIGHHYEHREIVVMGASPSLVPGLGFDPWKDIDFG